MDILLEAENISKQYHKPGTSIVQTVLQNISLKIRQGDNIAITGPSGSGKSTLLNILGTLDKPSSGSLKFLGHELTKLNNQELASLRNQQVGFVFQLHHLLPQCTVLENVLLPTLVDKQNGKAKDRAVHLLQQVGLGEHLNHRPGQLSGGECQRTAVVRALINQPQLILADEPTGSLDEETAEELGNLLVDLNDKQRTALVIVTHSPKLAKKAKQKYRLHHSLEAIS